ncbi:MAG: hypothetical protein R2819_09930 [Allomuricauda sp.]
MKSIAKKVGTLAFLLTFFMGFSIFAQEEMDKDPSKLLDFWVGDWEASWDNGDGTIGHGTNKIERILDGTVIRENFEILDGQNKGFKGTSISVYQARAKKWRQSWADNQGGFFCFNGDLEGDRKTFQTEIFETKDGKKVTQRMVFHNITEDSMIWDWELSNDSGETWTLNWQINYKRKG